MNASIDSLGEGRAPMTAAQQALAVQYLPLARNLAKGLKANWPLMADEFESAACLALVEAAQSYDPARNVKFGTFARFRIRGALSDVQRDLLRRLQPIEAASAIGDQTVWGHEDLDPPHRVDDSGVGRRLEAADTVEHLLKRLPPKHAEACRLIYLDGKSQNEAAEWLGCSKSRMSYLHKESLELLNGNWDARVRGEALGID